MKNFYFFSFSLLFESFQMAPTTTSTAVPSTPDNDNNILVRLPEELVTPNNKVRTMVMLVFVLRIYILGLGSVLK